MLVTGTERASLAGGGTETDPEEHKPSLDNPQSVWENVKDFPLVIGQRLEPFHLEKEIIRLLTCRLLLAMITHLAEQNNNKIPIHLSIHPSVQPSIHPVNHPFSNYEETTMYGRTHYRRQRFFQMLRFNVYTKHIKKIKSKHLRTRVCGMQPTCLESRGERELLAGMVMKSFKKIGLYMGLGQWLEFG